MSRITMSLENDFEGRVLASFDLDEFANKIRAEAIEDYRLALQEKYESNKAMVKKVTNDRNLIVAVTNLDSGEIDDIAQIVLEKRMENAKNKEND